MNFYLHLMVWAMFLATVAGLLTGYLLVVYVFFLPCPRKASVEGIFFLIATAVWVFAGHELGFF